ncbi:MAG: phage replisome organizer N-terminal domain-containing protein [Clostridia bacterium]|nr:phage replisome organizer N-terminal domain-containing protein [Clostridia bacterium]
MDEVKWIKVVTDIFDNPKIKQLEKMPSGHSLVLMWLKLLCLCGERNRGSRLMLTDTVPYTDDMLAVEFRMEEKVVRLGLGLFESFGMIERVDGAIDIPSWEKYQNGDKLAEIREQTRIRVAKCRERRRLAASNAACNVTGNATESVTVTPIEEEGESDIDTQSFTLIAHVGAREKEAISEENEGAHPSAEQKKRLQQTYLGGNLGQGVVMMSDEQFDALCAELSTAEMEKYFKIVTDCESAGKHYRKRTHYQAILDMAEKDRRVEV